MASLRAIWRLAQARWLAQRTAAIVGVSEGVRQSLLKLGFPPERCLAIPNGIDMERFPASALPPWKEREPGIVMAARFARQKDHATLIQALSSMAQQGLKPVLYLAGGGKQRLKRSMQALARKLGVADQVQFLGHVQNLPAFLMQRQVCVLSTHYEGLGLSLLEGMAAGCACIASDVVGVREAIDHERTGLLVPESDAIALAAALQRMLTHPAEAGAMAQAARQHAETNFDVSIMQHRYAQLLHAVDENRAFIST